MRFWPENRGGLTQLPFLLFHVGNYGGKSMLQKRYCRHYRAENIFENVLDNRITMCYSLGV
jgi:hypothetical protein